MDPLPHRSSEPVGTPISVGALLRREGRGRHAFDRPLVPRGHSRPAPEPVPPSRHGVRKATAAAGALFAVGAAFGGTVLQEALVGPDPDHAAPGVDGGDPALARPGDGRPGGVAQVLLATGVSQQPDSLPRATGADIGRDALDAAAGTGDNRPGPGGAPSDEGPAPAPDPGDPGSDGPAPGVPDPDDAAPADPGPGGPDPDDSRPDDSGSGDSGSGDSGGGGPEPDAPDRGVAVPLPDLGLPPVEVPGVPVPGTPLSTPAIALSETSVGTPDLGLDVDDDGLVLDASRTTVGTPDLDVDEVDAGPLGLSGTAADLPDLAVGGDEDRPLLAVGDEPELTVPEVAVSSATLTTPDLRLGDAVIEVPDLATPELGTPAVPLVETVGGLLGG